VTNGAHVGQQ